MTQATSAPTQGSPAPAQTAPAVARTVCGIDGVNYPAAHYAALQAQRTVLIREQDRQTDARLAVAQRLRQGGAADGADVQGLQKRLENFNVTIASVEAQLVTNAEKLACLSAIPGATRTAPQGNPNSDDELAIAGLFLSTILALPLVIAWSRRLWRRSVQSVPYMPPELNERLMRIEQSVESVAIEVERVGEGQRFVTNLFAQNGRAIGAGAMEPVDVQQRERVAQERRDR